MGTEIGGRWARSLQGEWEGFPLQSMRMCVSLGIRSDLCDVVGNIQAQVHGGSSSTCATLENTLTSLIILLIQTWGGSNSLPFPAISGFIGESSKFMVIIQ